MDVVAPPSNIHLGEVFSSFQFVDEGGDEGEWVCVLDCVFIEISVILAGTEPSIFLLNKEEWGGLWQLRFSDFAEFEMFIDELLACLHLFWVHGVGFHYFWDKGFF